MPNEAAQARITVGVKPCTICNRPTKSRYAVCNREGTPCRAEYQRLWNLDQDKTSRNEAVQRYRRNQLSSLGVYAILFPVPSVLKIGLTANTSSARFTAPARHNARKRGWDTTGSACIWKQPGDARTEAWMQATLSFQWPGAFGENQRRQNRICEWFNISGLGTNDLVEILDEIYQRVPADRTAGVTLPTTNALTR